ncbi:MAG TPA: AlkA N-terminal domain-containing protein [Gemmatimonadales bacterium]|nr:AlkA N-terminal domain-containing protein [Gemmatimonadales bacterium]
MLQADICQRAVRARDVRFDGIFFVGITTTRVYCRPVCPARVSYPERRRFFDSAASAERAGYRPCLRCRPELAPGRALMDAVPRLARLAAQRIAAGALNGQSVTGLARELGVSERHLRRALERELGVSPAELAQTHRLLLAKRLLAETSLPVTRIAFASGFQSLRRFNSVFRERYRLSPSALRRTAHSSAVPASPAADFVTLTLAYRPPLEWSLLAARLAREAVPGVAEARDGHYGRTVRLEGRVGAILASNTAAKSHLEVAVSLSLLPVLMPLLARLRHLFDLDAEPAMVDAHLSQHGLGSLTRRRPGIRIPGAIDGFEVALRALLEEEENGGELVSRVCEALGEDVETGVPALVRLSPDPVAVARGGVPALTALGVPRERACTVVAVARAIAGGGIRLEPGRDAAATHRALMEMEGVGQRLATMIVMRALYWPDAFPASDPALQRATGTRGRRELQELAERWRPWRAYAAQHLWLLDEDLARPGGA